jgi:hypothetical protein
MRHACLQDAFDKAVAAPASERLFCALLYATGVFLVQLTLFQFFLAIVSLLHIIIHYYYYWRF